MNRICFVLILLFCQAARATDGDTLSCPFAGFQANFGYVIPFTSFSVPLSPIYPYGADISLNKFHNSFEKWKVFHAYWISGFQVGYFNFQNPDVLGSSYYIMTFAEPVIIHRDRVLLTCRGGIGLTWLTKVYDETENPQNQFFCKHLAFPLSVAVRFKYRVGENLNLTLSGAYNHISNGGAEQPNFGINFLSGYAGVEYFYRSMPSTDHGYAYKLPASEKTVHLIIQTLGAVTTLPESGEFPEEKAFILGFNVSAMKRITHLYSLNAGAEMLFDGHVRGLVEREGSDTDNKRFSLAVGQAFMFGNVIFGQALGVYLYSPYKPEQPIYQKYELGYIFKPGIILGIHLKAYYGIADYSGLSLSWITGWDRK